MLEIVASLPPSGDDGSQKFVPQKALGIPIVPRLGGFCICMRARVRDHGDKNVRHVFVYELKSVRLNV